MRMWMINPTLLCRQHLLGEHHEIHKHRHVFVRKYSVAGRRGQIEPESMKMRHDELAHEMTRRGMNHNSEYTQPDLSYLPDEDRLGLADIEASVKYLMDRCPDCAALIVEELT